MYPVIRLHTIEVEMTEDEYENLKSKSIEEQAQFICEQNGKLDVPEWIDLAEIGGALEVDYAYIRRQGHVKESDEEPFLGIYPPGPRVRF